VKPNVSEWLKGVVALPKWGIFSRLNVEICELWFTLGKPKTTLTVPVASSGYSNGK